MDFEGGTPAADHLCVLVHGLWGNPSHMHQVAKALRKKHAADKLHLLLVKRNQGSFTYDGIERGGERVVAEIQEELAAIRSRGGNISKISIVGYSLGGLVARYAVGLLYAKGIFDEIEPVNFTTFATPHLGVRTPLTGWHSRLWNELGARTLSMSGHQLFLIDEFRDTGRPLLAVLADPQSIFMNGLRKFKRRTLYSNIVNDRTVASFTSGIMKTDPYTDMKRVKANYVSGYEDVVLDPRNPVTPLALEKESRTLKSMTDSTVSYAKNMPVFALLAVLIPIGVAGFLASSVYQTVRSSRRIRLHELGQAGIKVADYRVPLLIRELRATAEETYESLNTAAHEQEYLASSDESEDESPARGFDKADAEILSLERKQSHQPLPTLALAPSQFTMINNLDTLNWNKYPVWIHNVRHSHAAIIVRSEVARFKEGYVVLSHWLDEEFIL
ncbi:putative serine esterase-domain-containing protein [Microdochium trichocladiopsis]|uniref:Serine esterase-domain-containing protein n=1 Tax=Microdochium trichocladiopsis TaxID=1682393 RepID=A0A9P8Y224_9PEZI|nr:putative serine esterase-domain-containing protein [Microdochium trichocladiopsis]KAH7025733.1 putative serine esterase-domain-containing protein [Microdochium trichocladiopsis]